MSEKSEVLLIDQYSSPLKLVESRQTPTGQYTGAVIAVLYGVLSDYGNETRNGRWYTGSLWKKVLSSELFNEALRTKTLFGEPDHPLDIENRLETHIPYVSHIIREPKINEGKQVVEGYLDILDTPNGRIIKTLIDYGCILGVSSRGSGDLTTLDGRVVVDENCYTFITWDIVARPSNKKARTTSVDNMKTALESIQSQVKTMINNGDTSSLKLVESLISNTDISDKDSVLNMIKESIESDDSSSNSDEEKVPKSDLDQAYERVLELKSENSELLSETEVLKKSLEKSENTISDLNDLNKNLGSMVTSYMEEIQSLKNSNQTMKSESGDRVTHNNEVCNTLESHESEFGSEELIENISDMLSVMLTESTGNMTKRFNEVLKKLDQYIDSSDHEKDLKDLNESLNHANRKVTELQTTIKNSQNENVRLIRKISSVTNEYFKLRCSQLGLNEQVARKEFNNRLYEYDLPDIDEILNELYSSNRGGSNTSKSLNETVDDLASGKVGSLQLTGSVRSKSTSTDISNSDDDSIGLVESIRQVRNQ